MSKRIYHPTGGKVLTKQADALKTDVNAIMERWIAHGTPPGQATGHAKYGDFSNVDDYHSGLSKIREAERSFLNLPASVRKHVKNDPGEFLDMVHDPARRGELEELGLVEHQAPEEAPPADPPEPPAAPPEPPPE